MSGSKKEQRDFKAGAANASIIINIQLITVNTLKK